MQGSRFWSGSIPSIEASAYIMMRSKEALKTELETAGLVFDEFDIHLEGPYTASDADWNYKDVPHLSFMHPGVRPTLGIVTDDTMITINMQKLLGLWLPMTVVNYHPEGKPQTYFTTWLFFALIVSTSYTQLEPLRCRVTTQYAVGAPWLLSWALPIIRFLLRRNNDWLMEGDIPMRKRRGELRARGYGFTRMNDEHYTFAETMNIGRSNVTIPATLAPPPQISVDLSAPTASGQYLVGDDGLYGLRLVRDKDRVMVFPRMCPHEGACLDDRPCEDGRIKCEWHGRIFTPLAEFDLSVDHAETREAGPFQITRTGSTLSFVPIPDAAAGKSA